MRKYSVEEVLAFDAAEVHATGTSNRCPSLFLSVVESFSLVSRIKREISIAATPEKLHMHDACTLSYCRSASHRQKLIDVTNALKYLSDLM